jgi:hypothetical protein
MMLKRLILFIFLTFLLADLMVLTMGCSVETNPIQKNRGTVWQEPNAIAYGNHPIGAMQTNAWFRQQGIKHGLPFKTAF